MVVQEEGVSTVKEASRERSFRMGQKRAKKGGSTRD